MRKRDNKAYMYVGRHEGGLSEPLGELIAIPMDDLSVRKDSLAYPNDVRSDECDDGNEIARVDGFVELEQGRSLDGNRVRIDPNKHRAFVTEDYYIGQSRQPDDPDKFSDYLISDGDGWLV